MEYMLVAKCRACCATTSTFRDEQPWLIRDVPSKCSWLKQRALSPRFQHTAAHSNRDFALTDCLPHLTAGAALPSRLLRAGACMLERLANCPMLVATAAAGVRLEADQGGTGAATAEAAGKRSWRCCASRAAAASWAMSALPAMPAPRLSDAFAAAPLPWLLFLLGAAPLRVCMAGGCS